MVLQIVVFLAILSILVLIHEFGHFIVGKLAGIGILEFALGLPFTKSIFTKKLKSGMKLSLYPILFGGFVSLLGEEQEKEIGNKSDLGINGDYFYRKPVLTRMAVVVAGVVMNFILAVAVFYVFLFFSGFKIAVIKITPYNFLSPRQEHVIVTYVQDNTPAKEAGLSGGQIVNSVDGVQVSKSSDFQKYIKSRSGLPVTIDVSSTDLLSSKSVVVTPRLHPPEGQGALGIGIGETSVLTYQTAGQKLLSGVLYGVDMLGYNLVVIKHFIFVSFQTKDATLLQEGVSGPIGIYSVVGDILSLGGKDAILGMLNFLGLMSISLAFMNILPFPALDGGKLFLLLIEGVTKKKLTPANEARITQVGMAILLGFIALVSYSDIAKFFRH